MLQQLRRPFRFRAAHGPPGRRAVELGRSATKGLPSMAVSRNLQWQVEETIDAPLDRTWAAIEDLSLIPQYHPVVRTVEFPSGFGRRAPGVEYKCIVPTGPRR